VKNITDKQSLLTLFNKNNIDYREEADGKAVVVEGEAGYVEFKFDDKGRLENVLGDR
jgi:hypothetical protein